MKNLFFNILFIFVFTVAVTSEAASSAWTISNSLKSGDPATIENICKSLGLPRRSLGLSKVQVLEPHIAKSPTPSVILAISWEGPIDGYVLLLDPSGKVLGKEQVGSLKSLCLRSLERGGSDVLIVDAIKGTGTGTEEDHFRIFSITDKVFIDVWDRLSYEKSFPMQAAPDQNYEVKASMHFDDINNDGIQEIIYTSKKLQYSFDSRTQKLLPGKVEQLTEVYVLEKGKYVLKDSGSK